MDVVFGIIVVSPYVADFVDDSESRLSDVVRAKPWDLLLKVGLDTTLASCESVLTNDQNSTVVPAVDDYRSNVLAQLSTLDKEPASPARGPSSSKGKRSAETSKAEMARTQSAVKLQTPVSAPVRRSGSKKDSSQGQGSSTRIGVGRRTGGKPRGAKTLILSTCSSGSVSHDVKQSVGKGKSVTDKKRLDELFSSLQMVLRRSINLETICQ